MIRMSRLVAELGRDLGSTMPMQVIPAASSNRSSDPDLDGVTHDSREVTTASLFACLRGSNFDGHDHAAQAVEAGAAALLVDHELVNVGTVAQLVVDDTRLALGPVSSIVYDRPSGSLTTVGITGTN